MELQFVAKMDVGLVRDHNEDNFVINPDLSQKIWKYDQDANVTTEAGSCIVVADGMGGANAGEVAAELAIKGIEEYFSANDSLPKENDLQWFMEEAILHANEKVLNEARNDPSKEGMGTTIVVAVIRNGILFCSWVGDSRAYLFSEEKGLRLISEDHSQVQEWVNKGRITEEEAFDHPMSNIITQCLGSSKKHISPGFVVESLVEGDKVMLCSDGLNGMLRDVQIEEILSSDSDLKSGADKLILAALEAGGRDNITVAMAEIKKSENVVNPMMHFRPVKKNNTPKTKRMAMFFVFIALGVIGIGFSYYFGFIETLAAKFESNYPIEFTQEKSNGKQRGDEIEVVIDSGSLIKEQEGKVNGQITGESKSRETITPGLSDTGRKFNYSYDDAAGFWSIFRVQDSKVVIDSLVFEPKIISRSIYGSKNSSEMVLIFDFSGNHEFPKKGFSNTQEVLEALFKIDEYNEKERQEIQEIVNNLNQ